MKVEVLKKPALTMGETTDGFGLIPESFTKLPLGKIKPRGWLKHQLNLMPEGMTGRLYELSDFVRPDSGWLGGDSHGWEDPAYWLRGFYPMAVLTGHEDSLKRAESWIEAVINSQDSEGYFGAPYHKQRYGKKGLQAVTDLWPHMIMLNTVIQYYEYDRDKRVIPFMENFFKFCRDLPEESFIPPLRDDFEWPKPQPQMFRAGDMLPNIYWLYKQTQAPWLLDLATRFYRHLAPPKDEWLGDHVVDFTHRFAYAGIYARQTGEAWQFDQPEYWYQQQFFTWGQQPRGIFAADERMRSGKVDPRQGFETCGMVEFAKNFYELGRITGNSLWADRCEDIIFNHFPAAQTPDLTGIHYLTASNMPLLDARYDHDFFNKKPQLCYSPHLYRCCKHNVSMGWPWFAQNLWQASRDKGLAAWLYAACEIKANVGNENREVHVTADTDYPFDTSVRLLIQSQEPVSFPLYLRVPRWCEEFSASVNGKNIQAEAPPQSFLRIEREWRSGDEIEINMPVKTSVSQWPRNGSVTVDRGPLSYSLLIEEDWRKLDRSTKPAEWHDHCVFPFKNVPRTSADRWPEWEVFPKSPWNYGLEIDPNRPEEFIQVKDGSKLENQPWTARNAPVTLQAPARRIPEWQLDETDTVQELRAGPIRSNEPRETVSLIPLGCARLRMACLPIVSDAPHANEWNPPERNSG